MSRKSIIAGNWPKYLLQWSVLAALIAFITGLIPFETVVNPVEWFSEGTLSGSMSLEQIMIGIAIVAAIVLFSKLFCAYICPAGTVQDLLSKIREAIRLKCLKIQNGSILDKILRIVKYAILFWVLYLSVNSSELLSGYKDEIALWMSITAISIVGLGCLFIDMFWCRYLCPLGAILNSLKFWIWLVVLFGAYYVAGVFGVKIPLEALLGGYCGLGYLLEILHGKPKMQLLYVMKDQGACSNCCQCNKKCPYHIDINGCRNGKVVSVDCTLCGDCVAACSTNCLKIGVRKNTKTEFWNYIPALITAGIIALFIWASCRF